MSSTLQATVSTIELAIVDSDTPVEFDVKASLLKLLQPRSLEDAKEIKNYWQGKGFRLFDVPKMYTLTPG